MTSLRKDAFELLEKIPEDKLTFVIQIMQGVNGLYNDDSTDRNEAFERLEKMRKKVDELNYEEELAAYREGKYGCASVG